MKGIRIQLVDKKPFLIEGSQEERPATKVMIGNIPLSCDNNEIEIALKKLGVETRSKIRNELARNKEGALTQWETGSEMQKLPDSRPLGGNMYKPSGVYNVRQPWSQERR